MLSRYIILPLLIVPLVTIFHQNGVPCARAEEEDEVMVENDAASDSTQQEGAVTEQDDGDEGDDSSSDGPLKPSPHGDTYMLFTKPQNFQSKLPAGKEVHFLVGFSNKGDKEFVLDTMDASFRYPMDFSFYIQNFTTIGYNKVVKPKQQATLSYSFFASESFSARPFGLAVNLRYRDADGNAYQDAVFNETVEVVEIDEGLDGETFFLYMFLATCLVLMLVAGQQFLGTLSKKKPASKQKVEMGTQSASDVDYDWLPKDINRSPKRSPRQSPRSRRLKRGTGSGEE
ncbi:translocon-associated protein subunit alpha [Rhipicephalus sanguineus]|uniref:translocon-associated protein subunit alpha n=1 Tax=Rhipicephalus sanguineus TaxID=34632 RepID=UPI00189479AB|nr:translocon-associated protein subunit alpha [Rhipicephalus sanguineus]